jgi:hypothetical protein
MVEKWDKVPYPTFIPLRKSEHTERPVNIEFLAGSFGR